MAECDVCLQEVEHWYNVSGYGCCSGLFCVPCKKKLRNCPYCRSDVTVEKDVHDAIKEKCEKYRDLVWYYRQAPLDCEEYWEDTPDEIKKKVGQEMKRIQETYEEEVMELNSYERGDWEHGFHSGMLAGMRYIQTTMDTTIVTDDGEEYASGGIEIAEDQFPSLCTCCQMSDTMSDS